MSDQRLSLARKHNARLAAVQAIYQALLMKRELNPTRAIADITAQWKAEKEKRTADADWDASAAPNKGLLEAIVNGVSEHKTAIAEARDKALREDWRAERMDPVLVAILHAAIYEFSFEQARNKATIIDEYANIAASFFDERETGFITSTLNTLAVNIRGDIAPNSARPKSGEASEA